MTTKVLPLLVFSVSLFASDTVLNFDAAQSKVEWTLNTVLHTVHGTFQLERKKRLHVDCIGPSGAECPSDSFESMPGVLQKAYQGVGTRKNETLRHVDDCAPRAQRAEEGPMCVTA